MFGNYKKHWDAHVKQEGAKVKMDYYKAKLLTNPSEAYVSAYFKAEQDFKNKKMEKLRAIKSEYQTELTFEID